MSTDWESRYRSADTPWDKGQPHPELLTFLKNHPMRGDVFVPGCGIGHDVRAIAATADRVRGFDIAPSAIKAARKFPTIGGEEYVAGDLFAPPDSSSLHAFDWVWEHTCFCAIDPQQRTAYVESIAQRLRPDGQLLACFYLDPGLDPGETGPPFPVSRVELAKLFQPRFVIREEWIPAATFEGREQREWMQWMVLR